MVWIHFSVPASFYRQGLSLVCRCFQLTGAWFPAAGTPHTGVRPWKQGHRLTEKEMRSIDLPGHLCDPTRARAGHRIDAVPASYPREVLRGERPKRVLVSFARPKETPSGKRPRQAGKPEPWVVRRTPPFLCPRDIKTAGETHAASLRQAVISPGRSWVPGAAPAPASPPSTRRSPRTPAGQTR